MKGHYPIWLGMNEANIISVCPGSTILTFFHQHFAMTYHTTVGYVLMLACGAA